VVGTIELYDGASMLLVQRRIAKFLRLIGLFR
jgi:hypothetical protein